LKLLNGKLSEDRKSFNISFEAANRIFGKNAAGSPFTVYAPGKYQQEIVREWSYAVEAGGKIVDSWPIDHFENSDYRLCVYGPNGFFREFAGNSKDAMIDLSHTYKSGNIEVKLINRSPSLQYSVEITDNAYKTAKQVKLLRKNAAAAIVIDTTKSFGWYDFSIKIKGLALFEKRYAGRVETGKPGYSDPAMGFPVS